MTRILLGLILVFSCAHSFADEVDGQDVVRAGLRALSQNLLNDATHASGLTGMGALVGFGLWTKLYRDWKSGADGKIRSERGDILDFVEDGKDMIERGLTLAQLVRRAHPRTTAELTNERIVRLALQPFADQLGELHVQVEKWSRETTWVNVGDTCAPDLTTKTPGP